MSTIKDNTAFWLDNTAIQTKHLVGVLRKSSNLRFLIKELVLDLVLAKIQLPKNHEAELIEKFRQKNGVEDEESYQKFLASNNLNATLLLEVLSRPDKIVIYREEQWGSRVTSLYLKYKENYDLITYRRLESSNENEMQEIYFRLKDDEDTWESLAKKFPQAPPGACIEKVLSSKIEPSVIKALRKARLGSIIRPLTLENKMTIVAKLESVQTSELDDKLRKQILQQEFDNWLQEECKRLLNKVRFL